MDPFFFGKAFGEETQVQGEVVFNTGMVGYCESLTDPSYNGQILLQTYPLVGNYGVPSIQKSKFQLNEVFESNSKLLVTQYQNYVKNHLTTQTIFLLMIGCVPKKYLVYMV